MLRQKGIIPEKEKEITELNKKLFSLKEKENYSVSLIKELDEELAQMEKEMLEDELPDANKSKGNLIYILLI